MFLDSQAFWEKKNSLTHNEALLPSKPPTIIWKKKKKKKEKELQVEQMNELQFILE